MSQVLPPLFIAISGLMLLLAVLALWQSLRALLMAQPDAAAPAVGTGAEARLSLVDEKATLLKAIKELEFERDLGKISEQDFEALNARYRARAKDVMRSLDAQLGGYRAQALTLVDQALAQGAAAQEPSTTSPKVEDAGQSAGASPSKRVCTACGAENDEDAAYCKKCGAALAGAKS